jgi:hypothetical protein
MYFWDGGTWKSAISPDGQHKWDGSSWQPIAAAQPAVSAPLLSEDGLWSWDGQAWQPVAPAGPPPTKNRKPLFVVAAVLGLVLMTGAVAAAVTGPSDTKQAGKDAVAAPTARVTDTPAWPTATPVLPIATQRPATPPPGLSQHDLKVRYVAMVSQDSTDLGKSMGDMGTGCGSGNLILCRAAVQTNLDLTNHFVADLDKTQPPDCLKEFDTQLRLALASYTSGSLRQIAGIDAQNADIINEGTAQVLQGTGQLTRASTLLTRASCP